MTVRRQEGTEREERKGEEEVKEAKEGGESVQRASSLLA